MIDDAMLTRITGVALLLVVGCGSSASNPRAIGQRSDGAKPPPPPSTELHCVRPDEAIGVCDLSHAGVMAQAAGLRPGARATFQLDGDYQPTPIACLARWRQDVIVDAAGLATAHLAVEPDGPCRLFDSMVVRLHVEPDGPDRGPLRFGTVPPPAPPP